MMRSVMYVTSISQAHDSLRRWRRAADAPETGGDTDDVTREGSTSERRSVEGV